MNKFVLRYIALITGESRLIRGNLKILFLIRQIKRKIPQIPKTKENQLSNEVIPVKKRVNSLPTEPESESTNKDNYIYQEKENMPPILVDSSVDESASGNVTVQLVAKLPTSQENLPVFRLYRGNRLQKYSVFSFESSYWFHLHKSNFMVLHNYDIECLQRPKWIKDVIIDLFMLIKCETQQWKNVKFLSADYTTTILGKNAQNLHNLKDNNFVFNKPQSKGMCNDIVFLPYSLHNHWCLVVLDFKNSTFMHYDPLRGDGSDAKRNFENFVRYCQKINRPGPINLASKN